MQCRGNPSPSCLFSIRLARVIRRELAGCQAVTGVPERRTFAADMPSRRQDGWRVNKSAGTGAAPWMIPPRLTAKSQI